MPRPLTSARRYQAPAAALKWLEHDFALLGVCCLQGSPSRWVATHRRHHEYADDDPDPHSPILGVIVRTVLHWHFTWSVNSITHMWGYRNYETADNSRNNALIAFISNGEGWHNYHHADPRSARHGHRWWEFDVAWLTIRLLMAVGLATEVRIPGSSDRASAA
jgi:fatty-acid desaturase